MSFLQCLSSGPKASCATAHLDADETAISWVVDLFEVAASVEKLHQQIWTGLMLKLQQQDMVYTFWHTCTDTVVICIINHVYKG